jgi:hypothetical protein
MKPEIMTRPGEEPAPKPEVDAASQVLQELNKIQQPQRSRNDPDALAILTDVLAKMTEMAALINGFQVTIMSQQRFIEQNHQLIHTIERKVNQLFGQVDHGAQHVQTTEDNVPETPKGWPKPEQVQFDTVLVPPEQLEDSQDGSGQQQEPQGPPPVTDSPNGPCCPTGEPGEPGPPGPGGTA